MIAIIFIHFAQLWLTLSNRQCTSQKKYWLPLPSHASYDYFSSDLWWTQDINPGHSGAVAPFAPFLPPPVTTLLCTLVHTHFAFY